MVADAEVVVSLPGTLKVAESVTCGLWRAAWNEERGEKGIHGDWYVLPWRFPTVEPAFIGKINAELHWGRGGDTHWEVEEGHKETMPTECQGFVRNPVTENLQVSFSPQFYSCLQSSNISLEVDVVQTSLE